MYLFTEPFCSAAISSGFSFTVCLVATNSPGVNNAGTVSLLPVPGTTPPPANLIGGIPATAPVGPGTELNNPGDVAARFLA